MILDKHKKNMKILYLGYIIIIIILATTMLFSFVNLFLHMTNTTNTGVFDDGTTIEMTVLEEFFVFGFGITFLEISVIISGLLLFCIPIYGIIYLSRYKESKILKINKTKFKTIKYLILTQFVVTLLSGITSFDTLFAGINIVIIIILIFRLKSYIRGLN
jgi:hypothetical protein